MCYSWHFTRHTVNHNYTADFPNVQAKFRASAVLLMNVDAQLLVTSIVKQITQNARVKISENQIDSQHIFIQSLVSISEALSTVKTNPHINC